jgi:anti-anti-sigma factor
LQGLDIGYTWNMVLKSFWIASIETSGGLMVRLSGELDMAGAEEVRHFIDTTLARDHAAVSFDCRGITFIDSIGVKALIHLAQGCAEMGIEPTFRMNARIERVMAAMGLSSLPELVAKIAG